jgi:hypothetical protein
LDGGPLPTERTAIKRVAKLTPFMVNQGWTRAFYFNQGRVMSPSDLSVGSHRLELAVTDSSGTGQDGITFFIDAAGAGACV